MKLRTMNKSRRLGLSRYFQIALLGVFGFPWLCVPIQAQTYGASDKDPLIGQLLSKLTLEEKVSLCRGNGTMSINALPKIGLNEEFVMSDGPNNIRPDLAHDSFAPARDRNDPADYSTAFPRISALAATWDEQLAYKYGEDLGEEALARGKDVVLGPGVNIMRTPICGRNHEYCGEDPYLAGRIAVGYIKGIQSKDVAACVKHFAANNQELNRGSADVEMDERTLREIYLPAFETAVKEGGSLSVMGAYNQFRGEFCCQNDYLLNKILKGEWGFRGFVLSDWGGLHDTLKGAVGGLDVEMNSGKDIRYFKEPLLQAVKEGKIPSSVIDDKAGRVLYVMEKIHKLGGQKRAQGSNNTKEHQRLARQVAEEAIVLLKNDKAVLPLDRKAVQNILVIGDNASAKHATGGNSAKGKPPYEIAAIDGLRALLGNQVKIDQIPSRFNNAFVAVPDTVIQTVDEKSKDAGFAFKAWKFENFDSRNLEGPTKKNGFARETQFTWKDNALKPFSMRWTATIEAPESGDFLFSVQHDGGARIKINGQPIAEDWAAGEFRSTVGKAAMQAHRTYEVAVEYGHDEGQGKVVIGWRTPSAAPMGLDDLAARAKAAQTVIFFTGNKMGRGWAAECEGADRPNMKLPEGDDDAIAAVLAANPNTIVVNTSGAPVEMTWISAAPTVVQYWFSGMEGGNALARVLFGEVNPSGKLPFTMPKQLKDSPAHALGNYNPKKVNYAEGVFIGYRWFDARNIEPMFPFGYGLSYTQFKFSNLKLPSSTIKKDQNFTASVDVTNTGSRPGAEVAQLYIGNPAASVPRPPRELKGFQKVFLQPNETRTVQFEIHPRDLAFWDVSSHQWKVEPGVFNLSVGNSSRNLPLNTKLTIPER